MKKSSPAFIKNTLIRLLINLIWVYIIYFICRIAFICDNFHSLNLNLTCKSISTLLLGGLHFDTSAICYTNIAFILLYAATVFFRNIPLWYNRILKWIYVGINMICVIINLADTVFFSFRLQRTTAAIFTEFKGEGNILDIVGRETLFHWYFIILAIIIAVGLIKLYLPPVLTRAHTLKSIILYGVCLCVIGVACVSGMRGSWIFGASTRPISINYAFHYTASPTETGVVLNTPFSILRTIGRTTMPTPSYFASEEELDKIYSPVHVPSDTVSPKMKNVVILIMESFSKEFIGKFNPELDNGTYKGYTPHLDNLIDSCLWYDEMIANTFYSIDAPPAILASIPRADAPFVVSPHSVNHISSIAGELKNLGYTSAFFHGADNSSLGISAFTRQAGFDKYFGRNEFITDPRFGGEKEFDGTWGIWDEPFLQFFCAELSDLPQPFLASVFTLSSHHPFKVPEKYKDVFTDEGIFELHKAVKYSDYALYRFFEEARKQPWFYNTIFVISSDHTSSKRTHDKYKNEMGNFRIPILIYDPSGELPRGRQPGIIQQIDIMPTLLNYLGYNRPYIAFGKDMFNTDPEDTWAINWNDIPTYIKGQYLMKLMDGNISLYDYTKDPECNENLYGKGIPEEKDMELRLKAFVQSYLERMNTDNVSIK